MAGIGVDRFMSCNKYIDGLAQDCSNSIANALGLLQAGTKPSICHWSRVTYICVSKLTSNGTKKELAPVRRQAIIWTKTGILLIRTLGTNFSEILSEIHKFSSKKMHLKMSSDKNVVWEMTAILSRPQCVKIVLCATDPLSRHPVSWSKNFWYCCLAHVAKYQRSYLIFAGELGVYLEAINKTRYMRRYLIGLNINVKRYQTAH